MLIGSGSSISGALSTGLVWSNTRTYSSVSNPSPTINSRYSTKFNSSEYVPSSKQTEALLEFRLRISQSSKLRASGCRIHSFTTWLALSITRFRRLIYSQMLILDCIGFSGIRQRSRAASRPRTLPLLKYSTRSIIVANLNTTRSRYSYGRKKRAVT